MFSILADMLFTASGQYHNRWPDQDTHYADRFTPKPEQDARERRMRSNPYSYFQ